MSGSKKSLFAQRMEKKKQLPEDRLIKNSGEHSISGTLFGQGSVLLKGPEAQEIHEENVAKLSSLSHEEIVKEREKLISELDPGILEFLKNKGVSSVPVPKRDVVELVEMDTSASPEDRNLSSAPNEEVNEMANKYLHMDVVEKEKLGWIGELPPPKTLPPDKPYQARFDFEGNLLAYSDDGTGIKVGLHNHGEEQERPGYTIQELLQLSRSSVLKQRLIALKTLSNVLAKAVSYDKCFCEPLIPQLLEADVYLLLRFSLDDESRPVVMTSAIAICNLFVNLIDEACLDRSLGTPFGNQQPSLGVVLEMKPQDVDELKDVELLKLDIIRGALRTDLLSRLRYILEFLNPDAVEIKHILKLLTRIVRHSYDSTEAVFSSPQLLIMCRSLLDQPIGNSYFPEALKLFRVISMRSRTFASAVLDRYSILSVIKKFISGEITERHPELMHLTLESFYTWQVFLSYNMAFDSVREMTPVLFRLVSAHIGLGQLQGSPMSDLEHATALLTTLYPVARSDPSSVAPLAPVISDMAAMFISRYSSLQTNNLSICKLIGAVLRLASLDETRTNLSDLVNTVLKSKASATAFQSLRSCSWLLGGEYGTPIENLPCLGSIPPLISETSSLPLVFSLASSILATKNKELMKTFSTLEPLISYVESVLSSDQVRKLSTHWYARTELIFLVTLATIYSQSQDVTYQEMFHTLSFQLLSWVQSGDKYFLPLLVSECVFNKKFFGLDIKMLQEEMEKLSMEGGGCRGKNYTLKITLLETAQSKLEDIEEYYMRELGLKGCQLPSPLVTLTGQLHSTHPALPADWPFLPILRLYNLDEPDTVNLEEAVLCLYWVLLIEEFKPDIANCTDITARFCRVCCVFLTGNDFFRDVVGLLEILLERLMLSSSLLDFNKDVMGLSSFYDFYRQLLEQFAAVSYCDTVFGQYILVPIQQRHNPKYKKLLWSEMSAVLRLLATPCDKVDMNNYLEPCETDPDLLCTYLHALGTGKVREEWSPVLYKVGIHHVTTYIRNNSDRVSRILTDRINKMGNQELKELMMSLIQK